MASPAPKALSDDAIQVLRELNPWWKDRNSVRPEPPAFRRPRIREVYERLRRPKGLIEILRGPRQVGKTTGIHQIIQDLIKAGVPASDILFVRFDLEVIREERSALRSMLRWFASEIRRRSLDEGDSAFVFLDEIHKLRHWHEEVKHAGDTHPARWLLTGSSSVLVARGGRESLAGRIFTTELPTFSFREVLESWQPEKAEALPKPLRFGEAFEEALLDSQSRTEALRPQQKLALKRLLERYYMRGGYPRLHGGDVEDDTWADYLVQTVFENVLGADIPDLFPVESPRLLRHLYLSVARLTGQIVPQNRLTETANAAGFSTNQPTVGKYLHYLADALLIREFRRYPLSKKASVRAPAKITLSDLGVRNAILRGAPSLWESDPSLVGPLVETLAQSVIRDQGLAVHYWRDFENPRDRRSAIREVAFVVERVDGTVLPIEIKFRKKIGPDDSLGILRFIERHAPAQRSAVAGLVVTRETSRWDERSRILYLPLLHFLLAF